MIHSEPIRCTSSPSVQHSRSVTVQTSLHKKYNKACGNENDKVYTYLKDKWGLVGYMVSLEGAKKLIDKCHTMTGHIDNQISRLILFDFTKVPYPTG